MSHYQGGRAQGRGGWGRGGGGGGGAPRGGRQYDNRGHDGSQYDNRGRDDGQYDNQGRANTANANWRRNPHNYEAGGPSSVPSTGYAGRGNQGQYPRQPYILQRNQEGSHVGTPAPTGPGRQETYAPQTVPAPAAVLYRPPARQQQARCPYTGTALNQHEGNQPRQPAAVPQVTLQATTGGRAVQEVGEESVLEEQMAMLAIERATSSSTGSAIAKRLPRRPGRGTRGERVLVRANHFLVDLPEKEMQLHHYDVKLTPTVTSMGTTRNVMRALVRSYQHSHLNGRLPVYDGRANLYTAGALPFVSQRFTITLPDANRQREGRDFRVEITLVGYCNMRHLEMFLAGRQPNSSQDTLQALDIVLNESLSSRNATVQVRSSFFSYDFGRLQTSGGLEIWRGFYQSLRPTQMGLSLNINSTAAAFYEPILVSEFVRKLIGKDPEHGRFTAADILKIKRNLKGVKVEVIHLGDTRRKFRISGLTALATRDLTFTLNGTVRKRIEDYFRETYHLQIRYLNLPCLDVGTNSKRPTYLPMELCRIVSGQRYRRRLNEDQTTNMLRATCQHPVDREHSIVNTIRDNRYGEDMFATEFGLNVSEQSTTVEARILPPPLLKYHDSGVEKECMPASGAWNMRNKKMVNGGKVNFWYCISFSPTVGANNAEWFCKQVGDMCRTSGMEFSRSPVLPPVQAHGNRVEEVLKSRYDEAVNALSRQDKLPELLIIILPNNSGNLYDDIKRICETDIGLITQCCLTRNVTRASPQFLANLALKINVKVGGRNTVLADAINREVPVVSRVPTIIFGADVSHPSPGEDTKPSIASVVASQDWPEISTYIGNVKAQNNHQEIVSLLGDMVKEFLISFRSKTGLEPQQIIFYRDGVSEGQFERVLEFEINAIRNACKQLHPEYTPGITFIVVQKRHHTRLFPMDRRNMDHKSGNILPGTVVDTQICHPSEFDFYLCSHAGIKGTSRPTHYHILWDDNRFSVDELQTLTYNLCYTYAKCTRSVSIVPPVYYAHHMAFRARSYLEPGASDAASFVNGPSMSRDDAAASSAMKELPALKENVKNVMFYC